MDAGLNETRMKMAGEFAEMALVLARDVQQAALAAKTTEDKIRLADAFHRLGRGLRQSLALHAELERDGARDPETQKAAETRAEADKVRRQQRSALVKSRIEQLIWTERERLDEPDYQIRARLISLLADEARAEGFLEQEPELVIQRLSKVLGLPAASHPHPDPRTCPGEAMAPPSSEHRNVGFHASG